jgi:hypothetical protein
MNTIDSLRRAATAQAVTPEERAEDERRRFITANAELAHLTVRQGYALRVLRGAALALVGAVGERDRAEAAAAHDDTGEQARARAVAQTAVQAAFTALHEALDETAEESKAAETAHQQLVAERDAAREGLAALRAAVKQHLETADASAAAVPAILAELERAAKSNASLDDIVALYDARAGGAPERKRGRTRKLTNTELIDLCGNSVCAVLACALVRANLRRGGAANDGREALTGAA